MLSAFPVPGCNNPSYSMLSEFAEGMLSFNSSSSPRAKHPPAPRSLGASSPSSCLQETKGTCSSPGSLPFSKLSASDQGHPQPQSEPRQVQVALSVPQQTPVSCLHWSAQLAILQRPAFCPLCLARAYQGHGSRRGAQQRCWLQTIPVPCSQSVSQSQTHQAHHTHRALPRLSIISGTVQDRQPNGSHRLGDPQLGLMLSARASRGEQQGEMLIRLQA